MFVIIVTILTAVTLRLVVVPYALVQWDEAGFLFSAYEIYSALRLGDIPRVLELSSRLFQWPPLQSLVVGACSLPFGFTIESARTISLLWFVLAGIITYALGAMVDKQYGTRVGIIAVVLFLTSPMMLYFGSVMYKEMMGAFFTLMTIAQYIRASGRSRPIGYLAVSLFLILLFFTKYQYVVIVAGAFFAECIIRLIIDKNKGNTLLHHLLIALPLLVIMELWIFYPTDRSALFVEVVANRSFHYTTGSTTPVGFALFFPRAIYFMYSASPIVGAALLLSLVLSMRFLKHKPIRILWLIIVVNIVLATIHTENIQTRYIATTMPFLFIVCGYTVIRIARFLKTYRRNKPVAAAFFVIGMAALVTIARDLLRFPYTIYAVASMSGTSMAFNQLDYKDKWYNYDVRTWPRNPPWSAAETPNDVVRFVTDAIDVTKPVSIVGASSNFSPQYFYLSFALERDRGAVRALPHPSYVVTLEILPHSRFNTQDHRIVTASSLAFVREKEHDPALVVYQEKLFKELGIIVKIFVPKDQ